jgi:integrase
MFTYADGRPIRPEYLTHRFRQLCKELGLPPIRLHDLRHGAATLALATADMIIKAARSAPGARSSEATVPHVPLAAVASGYCQM